MKIEFLGDSLAIRWKFRRFYSSSTFRFRNVRTYFIDRTYIRGWKQSRGLVVGARSTPVREIDRPLSVREYNRVFFLFY